MKSYEVVASSTTASLKKLLASRFGVTLKTIEAWCRPKESAEEATGTGKANPLDRAERAITTIYPQNAAGARRWVQYLQDVLARLEHERAAEGFTSAEHRLTLLARMVSESARAAVAVMLNRPDAEALRGLEEMLDTGGELAARLRAQMSERS